MKGLGEKALGKPQISWRIHVPQQQGGCEKKQSDAECGEGDDPFLAGFTPGVNFIVREAVSVVAALGALVHVAG